MEKTLVAYASKSGATEQTAQTIADVLRSKYQLEVDLINLKKTFPAVAPYKNVIIGAGVRGGKVYGEALEFLKEDFGDRKVAFFVCCEMHQISIELKGGHPPAYCLFSQRC